MPQHWQNFNSQQQQQQHQQFSHKPQLQQTFQLTVQPQQPVPQNFPIQQPPPPNNQPQQQWSNTNVNAGGSVSASSSQDLFFHTAYPDPFREGVSDTGVQSQQSFMSTSGQFTAEEFEEAPQVPAAKGIAANMDVPGMGSEGEKLDGVGFKVPFPVGSSSKDVSILLVEVTILITLFSYIILWYSYVMFLFYSSYFVLIYLSLLFPDYFSHFMVIKLIA